MNVGMRVLRGTLLAALISIGVPVATVMTVPLVSSPAAAQTLSSISVEGNRRVELDTVRSYFKPDASGRLDQASIDDALKALIETGLFQDVRINRVGNGLVVSVIENPVINRVAFEGNKKVKDDQLKSEIQSKPRGTFSRPTVQSDVRQIVEIYRHSGRYDVHVTPEFIEQPNNRVDLIFTITEGDKTGISSIEFIGNQAFSSYRLKDVIKTHESNFLSFLGGGDTYDPDRVEADRDLLRRYYLKHGYADVQIIAALTEYDPGRHGFLVTFKIDEGQQYRVGSVAFEVVNSDIRRKFDAQFFSCPRRIALQRRSTGEVRRGDASRSVAARVCFRRRASARRSQLRCPYRLNRIRDRRGPRTYIERINVRGNTRTRDDVIRREFDISEGDAYNRSLVDRAERRLKNLDFFKTVKITTEPGSSSDRVILDVEVEDKSTGDFSVSGGFSTTQGALAEVSVSERNLLGRGLYAKASVQIRAVGEGILAVVCRAVPAGLSRRARARPLPARTARQSMDFI